ncbi:MAG: transketolase family protein [Firmicutes bacterium]|jgi:transketolase|nr:transketolase family protein [Bacillota bacterium]
MTKTAAPRDIVGKTLIELGREYPELVVLDADVGSSTRSAEFAAAFPSRFFQMGIAEANMAGVAAGLAASGKIPVMVGFAVFVTAKAFEQVRQSVAWANLNVKIIGSHAGLTVGLDGASHQAVEDVAIMRSLPNMCVLDPADAAETESAIRAAVVHRGPVYVRVGRLKSPVIYETPPRLTPGKAVVLREGKDATIIACGIMVARALEAASLLDGDGISVGVVDMASVKPLDGDCVVDCAGRTGAIVTAENASIVGGLGSAVAEVLAEKVPVPMERIGIPDVFGTSSDPERLMERYGMTAEHVRSAVTRVMARKRAQRGRDNG